MKTFRVSYVIDDIEPVEVDGDYFVIEDGWLTIRTDDGDAVAAFQAAAVLSVVVV